MSDTERNPGLTILLILAATVAVAGLGALVSGGAGDPWYVALDKPALTPPGYVFGIVWPVLYLLMALSAIGVRLRAGSFGAASAALGLYFTQLAFNLSWSWAFFGFHAVLPAMVVLVTLWLLIVAMIAAFFRHAKSAALMQLPYLAWVSFAGYLNGYILIAN